MLSKNDIESKEGITIFGSVFGAPLIARGKTWLPITQVVTWGIMSWLAGQRQPERSSGERLGVGALTMLIVLGLEWGHNLAHAAAARLVNKPMDALWIILGMPRVIYHDLEDPDVSPRQHIIRALGGPIFNVLMLIPATLMRRGTAPASIGREAADTAVKTNTFLLSIGLLPLPGIDGGSILKWSLVARRRTPQEADQGVRLTDGVLGMVLSASVVLAFRRQRRLLGGFLVLLAVQAFGVALGLLKER